MKINNNLCSLPDTASYTTQKRYQCCPIQTSYNTSPLKNCIYRTKTKTGNYQQMCSQQNTLSGNKMSDRLHCSATHARHLVAKHRKAQSDHNHQNRLLQNDVLCVAQRRRDEPVLRSGRVECNTKGDAVICAPNHPQPTNCVCEVQHPPRQAPGERAGAIAAAAAAALARTQRVNGNGEVFLLARVLCKLLQQQRLIRRCENYDS